MTILFLLIIILLHLRLLSLEICLRMIVFVILFLVLLWHCFKHCPLIKVPILCFIRCTSTSMADTPCRIKLLEDSHTVRALMTDYMWRLVTHLRDILARDHSSRTLIFHCCIDHTLLVGGRHCDGRLDARWAPVLLQHMLVVLTLVVSATLGSSKHIQIVIVVRCCLVGFLRHKV